MRDIEGARIAYSPPFEAMVSLKPALASIKASCEYMGGVSRAKFYADVLPLLETVKLGARTLVVVASMDRLIEANRVQGRLMTTEAPCGADKAPVGRIDDDDAPKPGRRGRTSDAGLSQRGVCEGRQ